MIFAVNAVARTPLAFRSGRNATESDTLKYVPGGAVLGGLVNAHRLLHHNDQELETFLFQETTRISNLYPAMPPAGPAGPVYPFPTTAYSCKRFYGFLHDPPELTPRHGIHDQLFPRAIFEMSGQTQISPLQALKYCAYPNGQPEGCREEQSALSTGFYRQAETPKQWRTSKVKPLLRMHTGINRATGTVQEGILFSRSALVEGSHFWGTIQVADEVAAGFKTFVEAASAAGILRVGSSRSRGLGRIELSLHEVPAETPADLARRLQTFNDLFQPLLQEYGLERQHQLYLPLTLTSDAIILDHLLRYCTAPAPAYLEESWEIKGAVLLYSNARTRQVMGWNSLWQLPRPDELAIGMGSVFLYGLPQALDEALLQKLFNLQQQGIGIRRREGFGQLLVAHPFHWEARNL